MLATGAFMVIDATFFAAAMHKVLEGGWFPLLLGAAMFGLMFTWRGGRTRLLAQLQAASVPLDSFLESLMQSPPQRVEGTAVFLNSTPNATPHALLHSLKHYRVLHEQNVFLTVEFRDVPWVAFEDRVQCHRLGNDCWRVLVRYGFMNRPDIGAALALCGPAGLQVDPEQVSYFLSREKLVPRTEEKGWIKKLRDSLFATLARNAGSVTDYFNIPANRVVELGARVEI